MKYAAGLGAISVGEGGAFYVLAVKAAGGNDTEDGKEQVGTSQLPELAGTSHRQSCLLGCPLSWNSACDNVPVDHL